MSTAAKVTLLIVLTAAAGVLQAAASVTWLAYPASARLLAQAGGIGALAEGAESLGLNPAGMADLDGNLEAQVGYAQWPAEIDSQGALVSWRGGDGGLGVKFNYVDYGQIAGTVAGGQASGSTLHPTDYDAAVGGAMRFGDLALGAGAHWLNEYLTPQEYGSSPAFEAGAKYGVTPRVVASLSLLDAGATLNGSSLPTALRGGVAVQSLDSGAWSAAFESSVPLGGLQPDFYAAGTWKAADALTLYGGVGIMGNNAGDFETVGLSFVFRQLSVDYGFRTAGALGVVNELSLRLNV